MFASNALVIISLILLSFNTLNANADACSDVKAKSEAARISAAVACEKAAEIAINSADSTKAVAKKACDDAKIIAKDIADKKAAAACHANGVTSAPVKTSTMSDNSTVTDNSSVVDNSTIADNSTKAAKPRNYFLRKIFFIFYRI
uniref:Antifreeze protein n=1 Tax=Panagrolaimus davidi TaxID=227884 RepID=A0A914PKE2_9BILA